MTHIHAYALPGFEIQVFDNRCYVMDWIKFKYQGTSVLYWPLSNHEVEQALPLSSLKIYRHDIVHLLANLNVHLIQQIFSFGKFMPFSFWAHWSLPLNGALLHKIFWRNFTSGCKRNSCQSVPILKLHCENPSFEPFQILFGTLCNTQCIIDNHWVTLWTVSYLYGNVLFDPFCKTTFVCRTVCI